MNRTTIKQFTCRNICQIAGKFSFCQVAGGEFCPLVLAVFLADSIVLLIFLSFHSLSPGEYNSFIWVLIATAVIFWYLKNIVPISYPTFV